MKLDAHSVRRIAVQAEVDPKTVVAVLAGRGSSLSRRAVAEAIRILGFEVPVELGAIMSTGESPRVKA